MSFWNRRTAEETRPEEDTTIMVEQDGWQCYASVVPGSLFTFSTMCPRDVLCQFKHGESGEPFVAYAREFPPEFNIANLYWRLTGIGRIKWEAMGEAARQQISQSAPCGLYAATMGGLSAAQGRNRANWLPGLSGQENDL